MREGLTWKAQKEITVSFDMRITQQGIDGVLKLLPQRNISFPPKDRDSFPDFFPEFKGSKRFSVTKLDEWLGGSWWRCVSRVDRSFVGLVEDDCLIFFKGLKNARFGPTKHPHLASRLL